MQKAVTYVRVSSKEQEREGYSIPAQIRTLREYALKNGFNIVKEFEDSETAGKAGRTAFTKMVQLLDCDKSINVILVEKTDRLYRNLKDWVLIDDLGNDIHLVKEGEIISKKAHSSKKFLHGIKVLLAKQYIDNLSEEVKKGQYQKALEGKYPGGPLPLGYLKNKYSNSIEIDPERSEIIRYLYELYSDGNQSIDQLHSEARRLNLTYPKSGRVTTRSEIERMLKKEFYTGKFMWNGVLYQGDHPAIVDSMLFERVQNVFKQRSNGKFSKRNFTFSRLMECGHCNHTITAEIKKNKYVYYHCTGYGNLHKKKYVSESKIDSMFAEIVTNASLPYEFYEFMKDCLEYEFGNKKIKVASERERLELSKDKIENDMKKAFQAKIEGQIQEDFFKSVFNNYQKQLDTINYRLNNLNASIDNDFDILMKAIELSYKAESLYLKAIPSLKRTVLKSMLSNCYLKDATLYPVYNKAFDIFAKGIESDNMRRGRDSNPGYPEVHRFSRPTLSTTQPPLRNIGTANLKYLIKK